MSTQPVVLEDEWARDVFVLVGGWLGAIALAALLLLLLRPYLVA